MASPRAMLQLVPGGSTDALVDAVRAAGEGLGVTLLVRADDCFMGDAAPHRAAAEGPADALVELSRALGTTIDRDRSVALVGEDVTFLEPTPTPRRFQYLMRRRPDFNHNAYLRRYREGHSEFGLRTPNIDGYVQFHVDLQQSAVLGERADLRDPPFDSVSELHLRSVAHFVEGIVAHPEVSAGAQADEERFVDRPRSFGFVNRILAE